MDNTAHIKKYSVDLSFEKKSFISYSVASFDDVNLAYDWLLGLHELILREHVLEITDSDGGVVFILSHLFEFGEDFKESTGHFVTSKHWFWIPEDYVQADLPL